MRKILFTVGLGTGLLIAGPILTPLGFVDNTLIAGLIGATSAEAKCPKGQITCAQWCRINRPNQAASGWRECIYTNEKSCVKRRGSPNACVPANAPPA
jgi:hypothetical protein